MRDQMTGIIVAAPQSHSHALPSLSFAEPLLVAVLLFLLRVRVSAVLRLAHHHVHGSALAYESGVLRCLQHPLQFLCVFTVALTVAQMVIGVVATTALLAYLRAVRELGFIVAAAWFFVRWIDHIRASLHVHRVDNALLDISARCCTIVTIVLALLLALDSVGINVRTALAFSGVGGVALGFAGREIISNFFAGFMIYVTRPFAVGEWIKCREGCQLDGTVEDVGWYITRIRTWDKRPLYIPNSRFSTLIVENGSRMDNRRIMHTFHVRLEDVAIVSDIVERMENFLNAHDALDQRQHRLAYVDSFDHFSVCIWISCYTKSVFLAEFRSVQQDILLGFYGIVRDCGAQLASRNTRNVRTTSTCLQQNCSTQLSHVEARAVPDGDGGSSKHRHSGQAVEQGLVTAGSAQEGRARQRKMKHPPLHIVEWETDHRDAVSNVGRAPDDGGVAEDHEDDAE